MRCNFETFPLNISYDVFFPGTGNWRYKILIRFTMERYDVAVNQDHSKAAGR